GASIEVVTNRPKQAPAIRQLQASNGEDILLLSSFATKWIERRVAVGGLGDQRTVLDLAEDVRPPQAEISLVGTRLGDGPKHGRGGKISGKNVIRPIGFKAAVRRVDRYLIRPTNLSAGHVPWIAVDVVTGEMIALSGEHSGKPAVVCLIGILQANVRSRPSLNAVVPSHLVQLEEVRVIEDDAARILVGQMTLRATAVACDDLSERLDDMCSGGRMRHERIGVEDTGGGYASCFDLVVDRIESYRVEHVVQ